MAEDNGRLKGSWVGFTLDTPADVARAMFERRHGHPPAAIVKAGCVLLVGPIGGNGDGQAGQAEQLALFEEATT